MNNFGNHSPHRQAVVNGLAVVGFISVMAGGIWFAGYSARFVPVIASRIGAAAVYLGASFNPAPKPALVATSTAAAASSTPASATTTAPTASASTTTPVQKPVTPTAGKETSSTVQIGGTATTPPALHGLPDLAVNITSIGYLSTTTATSFIASSTVPAGSRPAIKFTVKNVGTNITGKWKFTVAIPTGDAYLYTSPAQQSLAPGDSIDYTLGFDQALPGSDKTITVTVNPDHSVIETTTNNDVASTTITVLGK